MDEANEALLKTAASGGTETVTETLIDPKWWFFGLHMEGANIPLLRIAHPRHGNIDMLMTTDSVRTLWTELSRCLQRIDHQAKT